MTSHPKTDPARLVVAAQMLLDLVIIGAVVRVLLNAAKSRVGPGRGRRPALGRDGAPSRTPLDCAVRLAVLVSGSGTILQAMFEADLPVTVVLSDRPCAALALAEERGVATELVDRRDFGGFGPGFDRGAFTEKVAAALVAHRVDMVAMAGFGTVMTEAVHTAFPGRILNTHPALLPAFPGWHGVRDALAPAWLRPGARSTWPPWRWMPGRSWPRRSCRCCPDDTEETLHERIKVVERTLYPATVAWALDELAAGREIEPGPPCERAVRSAMAREELKRR